jgi:hypothetical protein
MAMHPDGDPWKVAEDVSRQFKPIIEKRLGLSKTDKAVLEDAKMQGLVESKGISPAAHKAYRDKSQEDRGWEAVQKALKELPPPPQPGVLDRLLGIVSPSKARKPAGVMSGE